MTRLDEAAQAFIALFERLGLPYAVMGGLAVRIYGLPRPTFDVDFTVAIARSDLPELYRGAEAMGFAIPPAQSTGSIDEVQGMPVVKFQWFVADRAIDVDAFLAETPFQQQLLSRRRKQTAEGWHAWFISPEDLILLKLLANRAKDQTDISDILFVYGQLDESYLQHWAQHLNVSVALVRALESYKSE